MSLIPFQGHTVSRGGVQTQVSLSPKSKYFSAALWHHTGTPGLRGPGPRVGSHMSP